MFNKRGSVLVMAYIFLVVLLVFGGIFASRTIHEQRFFELTKNRLTALYLAESAVDAAIKQLTSNYNYAGTSSPVSVTRDGQTIGQYESTVSTVAGNKRQILAYGYVPLKTSASATRDIEAVVKRETPPDFYDYAIYSADDIDLNGNSYVVNGDVIYGGDISYSADNVSGTETNDPTVFPLATFDFSALRDVAIAQGNLYDADRLKEVEKNKDNYPTDFWYTDPTDPSDPTTGVPNVVYVEGDMVLNGNIGTPGGFFLVVGNVLTDPDDTSDTDLNGNGTVNGCIYTTGKFSINGGGGNLNINGGVWAGTEAEMNGNATIAYNQDFMDSIQNMIEGMGAGSTVQLLSWREI